MTELNTTSETKDIRKTMKCPLCTGRMLEGRKSWFCENWKQGCTARIWKETYGRHLTVDEVCALLSGNKLGPFDLTSLAGKKYRAALVYDKEIRKVRPVFEEQH